MKLRHIKTNKRIQNYIESQVRIRTATVQTRTFAGISTGYSQKVVEFGVPGQKPLNIHGNAGDYKPFPDLIEMCPDDGLVLHISTSRDHTDLPSKMSCGCGKTTSYSITMTGYRCPLCNTALK